ncbi:hypothetical protein [Salipiger mucosus]|uniref:Uncharacterized protein n=1 Tax=Salipiger mucosus DSM 16094 TaxID=1123237 RepID=S9RIS8_9RHOB|nr:hypothetical protein [Salipiger mucosus]EPX78015.1 hypothetical protein Salmuc_03337 [Salipiger mucosus DSM 16094]
MEKDDSSRQSDKVDDFPLEGLADEISSHPLAGRIHEIARAKGIELNDLGAIRQVLDGLSSEEETDPRLVFLLGMFVERILHHEEIASMQEDTETDVSGH